MLKGGKFYKTYNEQVGIIFVCLSQWPRRLRYELSSLARTLGSWVRIPLKAWMSVYAFILCLCCSVYR
jgi:hypothetical protein